MGLLCDRVNGFQLLAGVQKTFVPARNVIVSFDTEDVRVRGALNDVIDPIQTETVTADANEMSPVSAGGAVVGESWGEC